MAYLWKSVVLAVLFAAVNWAIEVSGLGFTTVEPLARYLAADTGFSARHLLLLQTGTMTYGVFTLVSRIWQAAAPSPRRPSY